MRACGAAWCAGHTRRRNAGAAARALGISARYLEHFCAAARALRRHRALADGTCAGGAWPLPLLLPRQGGPVRPAALRQGSPWPGPASLARGPARQPSPAPGPVSRVRLLREGKTKPQQAASTAHPSDSRRYPPDRRISGRQTAYPSDSRGYPPDRRISGRQTAYPSDSRGYPPAGWAGGLVVAWRDGPGGQARDGWAGSGWRPGGLCGMDLVVSRREVGPRCGRSRVGLGRVQPAADCFGP